MAASGPCSTALSAFRRVATTASGACSAIACAIRSASSNTVVAGTTFCNKVQPQRFVCAKFVARQQVQHCIAEPRAFRLRSVAPPVAMMPRFDLQLREPAVVRRHHDIGCQHEFDVQRVGDAL